MKEHVNEGSPEAVNIDHAIRDALLFNLASAPPTLFLPAQTHVRANGDNDDNIDIIYDHGGDGHMIRGMIT